MGKRLPWCRVRSKGIDPEEVKRAIVGKQKLGRPEWSHGDREEGSEYENWNPAPHRVT